MFPTYARRAVDIARAIQRTIPRDAYPSLNRDPGNLYEVLSRYADVKGKKVHQTRWSSKNIDNSYWIVDRARFKCEGKHGKAWGYKFWKGVCVSKRPEEIRGGLKYTWLDGASKGIDTPRPKTSTV